MPAPYGLTTEGFSRPTVEELRAQINQRIWDTISPTLDLSDRVFEGHLVGIVAELVVLAWEMGEAVYGSIDPDKAIEAALDAVCILTGTTRKGAYASTAVLTLTGDPATLVPILSAVRVPAGTQFATLGPATLVALDPWIPTTPYALDDQVTNGGNAYVCRTAGISAGAGGPTTTSVDITDGAAHWRYLGEGTAAIDVSARASAVGPLVANSGTITEIVTPVGGWLGVVNVLDAAVGANQMSNEALRVLRMVELAKPGSGTVDAIEADLVALKNPDVISAIVFHNEDDVTDADGVPPHSVEALVRGGSDQAIWNQLLQSVVAGIKTWGTEVGTAADRRGRLQTMRFSRPVEIPVYVVLTVERDPLTFPADGEDAIKTAIVAWGDAQATGKNVVASRLAAAAFIDESILDVAALIGTAPAPGTDVTIQVGTRELMALDTSRISITFVDGVP